MESCVLAREDGGDTEVGRESLMEVGVESGGGGGVHDVLLLQDG